MKKYVLFCFTAILQFIAGVSLGWGQGVSSPDDLVWVAPDSSCGPALFFNDDLTFVSASFGGLSIELRRASDGSLIKRSIPLISTVDNLYLSPDNKLIAIIQSKMNNDKISFTVWDAVTLENKFQYVNDDSPTT
jgi:hypothetical protein